MKIREQSLLFYNYSIYSYRKLMPVAGSLFEIGKIIFCKCVSVLIGLIYLAIV